MNRPFPKIVLVGTGVVGRAIIKAHTRSKVSVRVTDQDHDSLLEAVGQLQLDSREWSVSEIESWRRGLPSISLVHATDADSSARPIVIESIAEKLDVKRGFFSDAAADLPADAVLCSNTSTLRIAQIGEGLPWQARFCGMHFFMPVDQRPAVEIVRTTATSESTIAACLRHAERLNKTPLLVRDSPGFIVNRLLSPYLNEALLLLCRDVTAERLESAALRYGMPMSPLELIDWIGTRTMFDAGRAFWQAFPLRFDPAPILPALVKAKRSGRGSGGGLYDYPAGQRSGQLSVIARDLAVKYQRHPVSLSDDEVMLLLAVPMWIEAAYAFGEQVVTSLEPLETALQGGLGYRRDGGWLDFFDSLGSHRLQQLIATHAASSRALQVPPAFSELLSQHSPSDVIRAWGAADRPASGRRS